MKITRREFIRRSAQVSAAALASGVVGTDIVFGRSENEDNDSAYPHPNILLLITDQQHMPPPGYGPDEGYVQGLKEILGFQQTISPDNPFTRFFPGYLRLRQNGVVLRTHYTAASACVPSRACIMTGSYSTGVTQTDGLFKIAEDVPWLDPDGIPTIGDWFRSIGYTTHYYGKWHVSYPPSPGSLEDWGFSNWERSYPEPHGSDPNNLGVYRDIGFAENLAEFLQNEGQDGPWLAVGSLVNPHDLGAWPVSWQVPVDPNDPTYHGVVPWTDYPPPPAIPSEGEESLPGYNELVVDLNPGGFPQDTCSLSPTYGESLNDKPRCQYDYSLKFGLMFKSAQEYDFQERHLEGITVPHPFQLQEDPSAWSLAYNERYVYCHYLADLQLRKMLQALDKNNLTENTIVVFLSDHGEMAGAHGGMIQKWHNAYEEAVRVPMVISSPLVNKDIHKMREILQPTSSIDLAPTLLALAGYDPKKMQVNTAHGKPENAFVGANLAPYIKGDKEGKIHGPDGKQRTGVLFVTNDTISEPGDSLKNDEYRKGQYDAFLDNVEKLKDEGYPLESGSVTQPNNVRSLCTGDWKIVRYYDPSESQPEEEEWELYYLGWDPIEQTNLVDFKTGEVRDDVTVPGMTLGQLRAKNEQLKKELARQEAAMLGESS